MNESIPTNQVQIERTASLFTITQDLVKFWAEGVTQSKRHDHSVTVWIVGLCGGGVVSVGHVIGQFSELNSLSFWPLVILYVPFVVGIFSGIVHSYVLTCLMELETQLELTRRSAFAAILFEPFQVPKDIPEIRSRIIAVAEGNDQVIQDRSEKLGIPKLEIWLSRVQHLPMSMFGIGVMAVVFTLFWARGATNMSGEMGNWVEALQVVLAITGSWFLAFGITHTIKMKVGGKEEQVTDTSTPAVRNWMFWLGLGLISLAGVPPVGMFLWSLFTP